jgi:hypothetical protein
MTWYAVVDDATGRLLSVGSIEPAPSTGRVILTFADRPDQDTIWNPATRTFSPRPPDPVVDRLQDMANHPALAAAWSRLTPAQRTAMRKAFVWLLGSRRFRTPNEEVALDPPNNWPTDPTVVIE